MYLYNRYGIRTWIITIRIDSINNEKKKTRSWRFVILMIARRCGAHTENVLLKKLLFVGARAQFSIFLWCRSTMGRRAMAAWDRYRRRAALGSRPSSCPWSRGRQTAQRTYPARWTLWTARTCCKCEWRTPATRRISWRRTRKASWPCRRSSKRYLYAKTTTFKIN